MRCGAAGKASARSSQNTLVSTGPQWPGRQGTGRRAGLQTARIAAGKARGPGTLAVTQAGEIKAASSRSLFCWLHLESWAAGVRVGWGWGGLPGALHSCSWPSLRSYCELAHE